MLREFGPDETRKLIESRTIHQYKFRQVSRIVVTLLGIISEIELLCNLNNATQIVKIWLRLAAKNADAKECFEARYKSKFGLP